MLLDHPADSRAVPAPDAGYGREVASLRLMCLVRAGDGYLVRAVGELTEPGPARRQVDISFGDAADRGRAGELEAAVRQVQHWCDDGSTVVLIDGGAQLVLRGPDGTEVPLPAAPAAPGAAARRVTR